MGLFLQLGCSPESNSGDDASQRKFTIERPTVGMNELEAQILKLNVNEEIILTLQPILKELEKKLQYESELDFESFCDHVIYNRARFLEPGTSSEKAGSFEFEDLKDLKFRELEKVFWKPVTEHVKFEDVHFGVLQGELAAELNQFEMLLAFEGRGATKSGDLASVHSKQRVVWELLNEQWKIRKWEHVDLEINFSKRTMFSRVTQDVIKDQETLSLVERSRHEKVLLQRAETKDLLAGYDVVFQYFTDWNSLFQYPGVSVVDFNDDGWDDLFLTNRFERNCLLENKGGGQFVDVTKKVGLEVEQGMSNCALFADFDNDGDQDLLLCRTFQPSQFYRNSNGKFELDKEVNQKLQFVRFVSSGSVVDVNRDGLLDVYLSTYVTKSGNDFRWIQYAVRPELQRRFYDELTNSHSFIDRKGPPNILLMNNAGNLEPVSIDEPLDQWRNSYQSVWLDYDKDGDSDVYVCNDFAPDALLRNDTMENARKVSFVDVTDDSFDGGSMGFGMGASTGDFDRDGDLDLYISNMFSKAGRRIANQLGDVDPRISVSAQGNFLYEFNEGKFKNVAGIDSGFKVAKVGWSFGGQFIDVNNDSNLDIFVPSGFFTAPESISDEIDL